MSYNDREHLDLSKKAVGFMPNNITELIKNDNKIDVFQALYCDEKYINGTASDFEFFDEWERILPLAVGTREADKYCEQIGQLGLSVLDFEEYSRERSCERWIRANEKLVPESFFEAFTREAPTVAARSDLEREPLRFETFRVFEYVSNIAKKCNDFFGVTKAVSEAFYSLSSLDKCIYIDLSSLKYSRPDRHAASVAYEKLKCDEKLNEQDKFILLSQLTVELLIDKRSGQNTVLFIGTDGELGVARDFLSYLFDRSLFLGKAYVCVTEKTDMACFSRLGRLLYPSISVYPCLRYESVSEDDLIRLFSIYPIGAFYISEDCDPEKIENVIRRLCRDPHHAELLKKRLLK